MSFCCTSLRITMGCWQGFALSNLLKYGLHADNTTLCAVNEHPSQANVTSTKSSSSRKCRNDDRIEEWKSFQRSEYCCSGEVSPPIGQREGAISTPMIKPFQLRHWMSQTYGPVLSCYLFRNIDWVVMTASKAWNSRSRFDFQRVFMTWDLILCTEKKRMCNISSALLRTFSLCWKWNSQYGLIQW